MIYALQGADFTRDIGKLVKALKCNTVMTQDLQNLF